MSTVSVTVEVEIADFLDELGVEDVVTHFDTSTLFDALVDEEGPTWIVEALGGAEEVLVDAYGDATELINVLDAWGEVASMIGVHRWLDSNPSLVEEMARTIRSRRPDLFVPPMPPMGKVFGSTGSVGVDVWCLGDHLFSWDFPIWLPREGEVTTYCGREYYADRVTNEVSAEGALRVRLDIHPK
jgi:hypothetical protein